MSNFSTDESKTSQRSIVADRTKIDRRKFASLRILQKNNLKICPKQVLMNVMLKIVQHKRFVAHVSVTK